MSRSQIDQYIDDEEEETCPLCVEEFDLSDRNFRPCPCGYQICQFCYNNIKTTMNGLCPACRRPYDDKNIEWKVISPEEMASYKADLAQKAKKSADARRKEAQKREADTLSKKHLAGLRVVQKNLVYVTGLSPNIREDQLLQTLRGDQYFGQYGKIVKIVVSKAKDNSHGQQSVGVYVTFANKEDAAKCIAAVDGSQNGDRVLRAQYGTTKYCSAYLRNEECKNRNCMFLHEPGEENESFTRQDLSSMSAISTQQPIASASSSRPPQPQPPPQQALQPVAAAVQPTLTESASSPTEGDRPALPTTASWASKSVPPAVRRGSRAPSASTASPSTAASTPAVTAAEPRRIVQEKPKEEARSSSTKQIPANEEAKSQPAKSTKQSVKQMLPLEEVFRTLAKSDLKFSFSTSGISPEDLENILKHPLLFDPHGGMKRRIRKEHEEQERAKQREAAAAVAARAAADRDAAAQVVSNSEQEETTEGGSLQLGGEPEEPRNPGPGQHTAIRPPSQQALGSTLGMGKSFSPVNDMLNLNINGRTITPQQHQQQFLLQQFKASNAQASNLLNAFHAGQGQPINAFSMPGQQGGNGSGHARNQSRFSFANDSASASASVKPVANAKLMNQQSSMMPPASGAQFNSLSQPQHLGNQFYMGAAQGPPPGLKTTGTPPVSGGGMFAQGHGFATSGLGYGANVTGRSSNDEMLREMLRSRNGGSGGAQMTDAAKRELFPSFLNQYPPTSSQTPAPGVLSFPYGSQPGAFQDSVPQKQKKKGKKHRHANTSSSGGGGVVDVADPSILHSRLHQGGASAGQGMYSSQGQVDREFPPLAQASKAVDDLVGEAIVDSRPPSVSTYGPNDSRRSTPSIPPGFEGTANPAVQSAKEMPPRPSSLSSSVRTASAVTPAVPVLATTPRKADTSPKKDKKVGATAPTTPNADSTNRTEPSESPIPVEVKPAAQRQADEKNKPAALDAQASTLKAAAKDSGDFQVMKKKESNLSEMRKEELKTEPKDEAQKVKEAFTVEPEKNSASESNIPKSSPERAKRQPPGKLDISAATALLTKEAFTATAVPPSARAETPVKTSRAGSIASTAAPRATTPAAIAVVESPMKRTAGVLRIVDTPKSETPPTVPATIAPVLDASQPPARSAVSSRQPSIASISIRPGTPASEHVSDNVSLTSTSISRANSPPPTSRIGSAPVRIKTKSQQKKERQERSKVTEEPPKPVVAEVVQAPIMGRKKKAKKDKPTTATALGSAPISRASSPGPKSTEVSESTKPKETPVPVETPKREAPASPAPSSPTPEPELTPAAVLEQLKATGELISAALEFFKPITGVHNKHDIAAQDLNRKDARPSFTQSELDKLAQKKEIRKGGEDGRQVSRQMITPSGSYVRGLTKEQEDYFLELEKRVMGNTSPARFVPNRGKGIEQLLPVVLGAADGAQPKSQKAQMEEAFNYLNQYVLPMLPTPRNEKAPSSTAASKSTYRFHSTGENLFGLTETQILAQQAASAVTGQPPRGGQMTLDGIPMMTVEEAEQALLASKKECEVMEKKLNGLIKRNKRFALGSSH